MTRTYAVCVTAVVAVGIFLTIFVQIAETRGTNRKILADAETQHQELKNTIDYDFANLQPIPDRDAAAYPYTLFIPHLNLTAPVVTTGLEADGRMAVPNNFTEVGLFGGGARPGEAGTSIMGAHVDNGGSTPGVFKHLEDLKVGDDIYVTGTQTIHYKVTAVKVYDKNEQQTDDIFYSANGSHLNLITCHGRWLSSENTYAQRLVVFTDRV